VVFPEGFPLSQILPQEFIMESPQIYLYKITFEEIPDWYWGAHKEKKAGEFYMGSPVTNSWKWEFYTPKKQILQFFEYNEDGWKQARVIEDRLILPDLNNPLCLNENVGGTHSLEALSKGGKVASEKIHKERDEFGRSLLALRLHEKKDEQGRSVHGVQAAERTNAEKDEKGRSLVAMRVNNQIWESMIDGFQGNAGNVAYHNKANGWDPSARFRVN
jgi:hypothetical protein